MTSKSTESLARKWLLGWVLPVAIALLGFATIMAMGKSKPKQVDLEGDDPASRLARMPAVLAKPVIPFDASKTLDIDVTGVVVPFRQVTIAAEVGGRVVYKSEACRIGRFVEAGELLFRLDGTDYQLEVERLAALRDSEYAQQNELDQEVANAQRSLELADQDVALQERELQRLEKLPSGFASATELDQARRLLLSSSTQRLAIQNQLETLESKRTRIQLGERLAATQLAQAKINLARTEIKAPIAGVIVSEMVEQASYIQKGATLCVIHDTQRVEVSCNLRADQLMLVLDQKEDPTQAVPTSFSSAESYELPETPVTVEYRVAGRGESSLQWQGALSRYEGIGLNSQSRTIPIRITVDNPRNIRRNGQPTGEDNGGTPPALVQGMFVDCKIHTAPKRPLVLIPSLALRPGSQAWKFTPDPSILTDDSSTSQPEGNANKPISKSTMTEAGQAEPSADDLGNWMPGRVSIVRDLRVIRPIKWPLDGQDPAKGTAEYWVVDARDELVPGALMVVSPMTNLIGDGTDKARLEWTAIDQANDPAPISKDER